MNAKKLTEKERFEAINLPEIKGTTLESFDPKDFPKNEGRLRQILSYVERKLNEIGQKRERDAFANSEAGKKHKAMMDELNRTHERSMKSQIDAIEAERHHARRALALQLFGEDLLRQKKYLIVDEDFRLHQLIHEGRRLERAKSKIDHEFL